MILLLLNVLCRLLTIVRDLILPLWYSTVFPHSVVRQMKTKTEAPATWEPLLKQYNIRKNHIERLVYGSALPP